MSLNATRSKYWLSPGVDVPTRDELVPGSRTLRGFYAHVDSGEAQFVPSEDFMRESPLWRLDILGDIVAAVERVRVHALVEYFRECMALTPSTTLDEQLSAFRQLCAELCIEVPDDIEAILVLDEQFRKSR